MNAPVIDPRTKAELLEQIRALAREYTPEWKCGGDPADPASAIAELYSEMLYQTIDRYNALPEKYYVEFLNLLGVDSPDPAPASGYVAFTVHESAPAPVLIPERTQLAAVPEEGDSVIFETTRQIGATPARLTDVYFCSARENLIQRLEPEAERQRFFAPVESENLQRHRLFLSEREVLNLSGACSITVELRQTPAFQAVDTAKRLADPAFAAWSWFDGVEQVPFDAVSALDDCVVLTKKQPGALCPDENGRIGVTCEMRATEGSIRLDGVRLRSSPEQSLPAEELSYGDMLISEEGGYCFGRRPAVYDYFYIRSDRVFQKKNARILLALDIAVLPEAAAANGSAEYDWTQRVINKDSAVAVEPDEVRVSQVAWEYFNGLGWAPLKASGTRNPFSGRNTGDLNLTFDLPDNLRSVAVNAEEGYYIRARVVEVENFLSTNARWLLPFVKGVSCTWSYDAGRPVSYLCAENNGGMAELAGAERYDNLNFQIYEPMDNLPRSMYFRFDRSPDAMPLSLLFDIAVQGKLSGKVIFESLSGGRSTRLRTIDSTRNFRHTGSVYLYVPQPLEETTVFGRRGCWIRAVCTGHTREENAAPSVRSVRCNAVLAVQQERAEDQYFDTAPLDRNKRLELLFTPILDCQVWVDELARTVSGDALRLEREQPERVRLERNGPELVRCWVRWARVASLRMAGPEDRVYELDAHSGELRFGSGKNGCLPPEGAQNIRVSYAYGGGSAGNLPAGAINTLVGAIPFVDGVAGVTPAGGGVGRIPAERLERSGNKRLRHRGRALGTSDYEEMILEGFPRVSRVKCFSGRDETGAQRPGHVTVVVMCPEAASDYGAADLCEEIYAWLSTRCDCTLSAFGRLHVVPSVELTVNVEVRVTMRDLDRAAQTQQQLAEKLSALISGVWRSREIGEQIRLTELDQILKETPNVAIVHRVLAEGLWNDNGVRRACDLSETGAFPYATVRDGSHIIWIS